VTRSSGIFVCVLQSPLFVAIVVAAITLAVFIHVLSADFVMWDDDIIIYNNPIIRDLSIAGLGKIFTDVDSNMRYNPLILLGLSITYHFFKLNPFWYHLGNWLMHGLNTALVFLVLRKLLVLGFSKLKESNEYSWRFTISAGLATLLWSIHPMRVEPVAWCTDRTYCQSLLFLLLSLLFYLRANETDKSIRRHYILLTVSVILYIVSLLSHAIVTAFLPVLFILDIYPLRNFDAGKGWWKSSANRRTLLEKIPFAAAALAIAVTTVFIRVASVGVWTKPVPLDQFGLTERFMQAMYIWAYYIWRPWYPVDLSPVYTTLVFFNPFSPVFISSIILIIGIITLTMFMRHRWPLGLVLIMCHLCLLIPVLGVLEHPHYPCDRYSLFVSILWSMLLSAWLAYPKMKTLPYRISLVLSIIVISALGLMTLVQTRVWTNSKTLFEHMINTLGDNPYKCDIYWRLGAVYEQEGNTDEATRYYFKTVDICPAFSEVQNHLGVMLIQKNNIEEAIRHFNLALRTDPNYASAHINRAKALQILGRFDESIRYLDAFVRQKPDSAEGNYWISVALAKTGNYSRAITHLKETLRIAPDWVNPINDLARILATNKAPQLRDPNEAIRLARRGCELTKYQEAGILDTLAAAYASAGRFNEAVYYSEIALKLAENIPGKDLFEIIQKNLFLYQQNKEASSD
jgi:Flp pilus assembly protein TadD